MNDAGIKYCPRDEFELESPPFPDNSALREIMMLGCKCLYEDTEGCPWTGHVYAVEEHVTQCAYNFTVQCQFQSFGCDVNGTQSQLSQHMLESGYLHSTLFSHKTGTVVESSINAQPSKVMSTVLHKEIDASLERLSKKMKNLRCEAESLNQFQSSDDSVVEVMSHVAQFYTQYDSIKPAKDRLDHLVETSEQTANDLNNGVSAGHKVSKGMDTRLFFWLIEFFLKC